MAVGAYVSLGISSKGSEFVLVWDWLQAKEIILILRSSKHKQFDYYVTSVWLINFLPKHGVEAPTQEQVAEAESKYKGAKLSLGN